MEPRNTSALKRAKAKLTVRGGSGFSVADNASAAPPPPQLPCSLALNAAVAPPPPPPSASEVAMCAAVDAAVAETLCRNHSGNDEDDAVNELSELLADSKQKGDEGKVIAALFCMNPLEKHQRTSLRVVVIERVALQTPLHDAEEYAAFCSWMKWAVVCFVSFLLALLLLLLAVVLGPISLVLCIFAGIHTPSAATADQVPSSADVGA